MTDETKKKLTKEQALAAMLDDFELERLEEEAKGMSEEEIMADLAEQGLPKERVEALFAKQDAMIREAQKAGATAAKAPTTEAPAQGNPKLAQAVPFRRRFGGGVFVGFGLAATLALAALVALASLDLISFRHPETDGGIRPDPDRAEQLRDVAFAECGKGHWESCLEKLDQAQGIDAKSNDLPEVKDARARADAALHPEEEYDAYAPAQNNGRKTPPRP